MTNFGFFSRCLRGENLPMLIPIPMLSIRNRCPTAPISLHIEPRAIAVSSYTARWGCLVDHFHQIMWLANHSPGHLELGYRILYMPRGWQITVQGSPGSYHRKGNRQFIDDDEIFGRGISNSGLQCMHICVLYSRCTQEPVGTVNSILGKCGVTVNRRCKVSYK